VEPLSAPEPFGLVIVPSSDVLSTPAVYREFDHLGGARSPAELAARAEDARAGATPPLNDLQTAARSLCPAIDAALADVRIGGATVAMVAGSGPTVFGLFDTPAAARAAAVSLPGAIAVEPLP
jgi:4-diphosphocytidyl-2-C-methyl-D-erythritol kinase